MPSYKGPLSNKHIDQNARTNPSVILPLLGFVAMTAVIVFKDEEKKKFINWFVKEQTIYDNSFRYYYFFYLAIKC